MPLALGLAGFVLLGIYEVRRHGMYREKAPVAVVEEYKSDVEYKTVPANPVILKAGTELTGMLEWEKSIRELKESIDRWDAEVKKNRAKNKKFLSELKALREELEERDRQPGFRPESLLPYERKPVDPSVFPPDMMAPQPNRYPLLPAGPPPYE